MCHGEKVLMKVLFDITSSFITSRTQADTRRVEGNSSRSLAAASAAWLPRSRHALRSLDGQNTVRGQGGGDTVHIQHAGKVEAAAEAAAGLAPSFLFLQPPLHLHLAAAHNLHLHVAVLEVAHVEHHLSVGQ